MHRYHLYNYLPSEQMGCAHSNQAPGPGKCDKWRNLGRQKSTTNTHRGITVQSQLHANSTCANYGRTAPMWRGVNISTKWLPWTIRCLYILLYQGYQLEDKESSLHWEEDTLQKDTIVMHTYNPVFDAMESWTVICMPHVVVLDFRKHLDKASKRIW